MPVSTNIASTTVSTVAKADAVAIEVNDPESGKLSVTALIPSTTVSTVVKAAAVAIEVKAPESGSASVIVLIEVILVALSSLIIVTAPPELSVTLKFPLKVMVPPVQFALTISCPFPSKDIVSVPA